MAGSRTTRKKSQKRQAGAQDRRPALLARVNDQVMLEATPDGKVGAYSTATRSDSANISVLAR